MRALTDVGAIALQRGSGFVLTRAQRGPGARSALHALRQRRRSVSQDRGVLLGDSAVLPATVSSSFAVSTSRLSLDAFDRSGG